MLTGRPPFEGGSIGETFNKTKNLDFCFPEFLSENAKDLITCMLSADPGCRLTPSQILSHEFFQISNNEESFYEYLEAPLTCRSSCLSIDEHKSLRFSMFSPINTLGLQPFIHEFKNGKIEITPYGWFKVSIGSKLLEISPDGSEIYYKSIKYSLKNLPSHAKKLYQYAEKCLNTIQSKTPRVVMETKDATFLLMSNLPEANFEAEFVSGVKVYYQVGKEHFSIQNGDKIVEVNINHEGKWDQIIKITLDGLKSCIKSAKLNNVYEFL